MRASSSPPVFSHSNPKGLCSNRRNIDDEQIRAVADLGGLVGVNAYPAFVRQGGKGATVLDLVDHIDYLVDLIGPHQVGLGLDFCETSPETHAEMIASGEWSIEDYPDDSARTRLVWRHLHRFPTSPKSWSSEVIPPTPWRAFSATTG